MEKHSDEIFERTMTGPATALTVGSVVERAHLNARLKGFWDKQSINMGGHQMLNQEKVAEVIPEKLCLIHSEVSEALECYREKQMVTDYYSLQVKEISKEELAALQKEDLRPPKPEGFASEIADIVIRIADLCGALGINLEEEIKRKMEYNSTRPAMHGKVC